MITIINTALSTTKEVLGLAKELKPIFSFITGRLVVSDSQARVLKLFAYSLLSVMFFMAGIAAITLMLINLPSVGDYLEIEIITKISETAKYFMQGLLLTGYLLVFVVLNIVFTYSMYQGLKKLVSKFKG